METNSEIIEEPENPGPLERAAEFIIVPLMLGVIAIGFVGVCLRFMFGGHYALFWSEEVIRYAFIWLFWLCAPILVWRGALFSVDLVVEAVAPPLRWLIKLGTHLGIMFLMALYAFHGWEMAVLNSAQLSSALSLPLFWIYLAIPAGAVMILLVLLIQTIRHLAAVRTWGEQA